MNKKKTSHNLTLEALRLLKALAQKYGINQTAMLEIIIREKAKSEGLDQ
jgi:replication initiation and membrane attachment protein DnaB